MAVEVKIYDEEKPYTETTIVAMAPITDKPPVEENQTTTNED